MKLVFRVDASTQIGTGHVMRCLALAQAWQDAGGQPIFVMTTKAQALKSRLRSEGMEVINLSVQMGSAEDAKETATLAQHLGATWVVVDGYHFGAEYQQIIKNFGLNLLFFDDYGHAAHYYADIVLNQNISASESLYANREPYTQLLLGTRYALLRREFWQWRQWRREMPTQARKILVTLGGSDPDNVTLKVLQSLQLLEVHGIEAVVVVGGSNPHYEQLQLATEVSHVPIRLERNAANMPELMAWAEVAISAGGSTTWELAFMGLPSLIIVLADNQQAIAEKLSDREYMVHLGWHKDVAVTEIARAIAPLLLTSGTRTEMSGSSQELVDGEGTARVLMHLQRQPFRLRPVRQEDCKLLWDWANDPEVRACSFSSDFIPLDTHLQWFVKKLHDSNCYIFIALDSQDKPIGQVRFEVSDRDRAEIGISFDTEKRGKGYGSYLIDLAVKELFRRTSIQAVHALIKPHNQVSIRAFEKALFKKLGKVTVKGNPALHYWRIKTQGIVE
jgi:UDP-2,4-diacetamido-2,4,6-trideoxy-beta-L-altropyranose hydrolase